MKKEPNYLRLYIDECGDDKWPNNDADHRDRYMGLCGVLIENDAYVDTIFNPLLRLKRSHFNFDIDRRLPLHRNDIVRASGRFALLKAPQVRDEFNSSLLSFLESAEYSPIIVVIDKLALMNKYATPVTPYLLALRFLLQRAFHHAKTLDLPVRVAAERRNGGRDVEVSEAYFSLRKSSDLGGLRFSINTARWFPDEQLAFFQKDEDIAGLQIADMLARPMAYHALRLVGNKAVPEASPFERELIPIVSRKAKFPLTLERKGFCWAIFPYPESAKR